MTKLRTADEIGYVYELAKALMDVRERDYEGSWREEGLGCMIASNYKKSSQIRTMFENGRYRENLARIKEDLLDEINYGVLSYRLIDLMEEKNGH